MGGRIGVIADDLTGATTVGVILARSKARTQVYFIANAALREEKDLGLDAVVISTNSRPLPPPMAKGLVHDAMAALKKMGAVYFSKRTDTTMRGGVGYEIDQMLEDLGDDAVAIVVPAMPESRRILVGGYSVIDGVALIKTAAARDVRTPVSENYIPALLAAQTREKVDLVELGTVLKGDEAIREALREKRAGGARVIVVDAITLEDVDEIAKACVALKWNVLAADPGPFTTKLAYRRGLVEPEAPNIPDGPPVRNKTVLIAAGSATPVTKKQMEVLTQDERCIRISCDPRAFIEDGETALHEVDRAVNAAIVLLNRREQPRAILFETALHDIVLNLAEEDAAHGYTEGNSSADRINAGLGMIISRVLRRVDRDRIAGIYATGGDTMVNVCAMLGVESIEVLDYVIAQIDVGRLTGHYEGLPIIGKGGLTGHNGMAIEIVDRIMLEAAR